jgi:hypothetical protein
MDNDVKIILYTALNTNNDIVMYTRREEEALKYISRLNDERRAAGKTCSMLRLGRVIDG